MARLLGEGTVSVDGVVYRLRFDMNVLADLEEGGGRKAMEMLADLDGAAPSMATLRTICHAMLRRHHPDVGPEIAGDILSEDTAAVLAIINAAMPDNAGAKPGNGAAKAGRRR